MSIKSDLQAAYSDLHIAVNFIESVKNGTEQIDLDLLYRLTNGAKNYIELAEGARHDIECSLR